MKPMALALIFMVGCLPATTEAATSSSAWLTGKQLTNLITGKTVTGKRPDGWSFSETFHADHKLSGSSTNSVNGQSSNDSGTWRIKGNQYCVTWQTWTDGLAKCFWVRQVGPGKYVNRSEHGYEKQLSIP